MRAWALVRSVLTIASCYGLVCFGREQALYDILQKQQVYRLLVVRYFDRINPQSDERVYFTLAGAMVSFVGSRHFNLETTAEVWDSIIDTLQFAAVRMIWHSIQKRAINALMQICVTSDRIDRLINNGIIIDVSTQLLSERASDSYDDQFSWLICHLWNGSANACQAIRQLIVRPAFDIMRDDGLLEDKSRAIKMLYRLRPTQCPKDVVLIELNNDRILLLLKVLTSCVTTTEQLQLLEILSDLAIDVATRTALLEAGLVTSLLTLIDCSKCVFRLCIGCV